MALVTWNPARNLSQMQADLDRLFGQAFPSSAALSSDATWVPAVDLYETEQDLVVRATIPGVREQDLELTVTGDQLTLRGKIGETEPAEEEKRVWYLAERRHGAFARTFSLPVLVEVNGAKASLDAGVLTVTLPKAETARPKSIKIGGSTNN